MCSHIRQYLKVERSPFERKCYMAIGTKGVAVSVSQHNPYPLNQLKQEGYSEVATLSKQPS